MPLAIGLLMLASAPEISRVPDISSHGWPAVLPTTALLVILPALPTTDDAEPSALGIELARRCRDDDLATWQWRWMISRLLNDGTRLVPHGHSYQSYYGSLLAYARHHGHLTLHDEQRASSHTRVDITMLPRWPAGTTIYGTIRPRHWDTTPTPFAITNLRTGQTIAGNDTFHIRHLFIGSIWLPWDDGQTPLGIASEDNSAIELLIDIPARTPPTYHLSLPITTAGTINDYVQAKTSAAVAAGIQSLTPYVAMSSDSALYIDIDFGLIGTTLTADAIDLLAVRLDVIASGTTVGTGVAWWIASHDLDDQYLYPACDGVRVSLLAGTGLPPDQPLLLRIAGDQTVAMRSSLRGTYWSGHVDVPLQASPPLNN